MAAQPFQFPIPADQVLTVGQETYIQRMASIEDLTHALRELQQRITVWNAANPSNPI